MGKYLIWVPSSCLYAVAVLVLQTWGVLEEQILSPFLGVGGVGAYYYYVLTTSKNT